MALWKRYRHVGAAAAGPGRRRAEWDVGRNPNLSRTVISKQTLMSVFGV